MGNRIFNAQRPNQLWVLGFNYVSARQGWLYVALVIDVYARRIMGWRVMPRYGLSHKSSRLNDTCVTEMSFLASFIGPRRSSTRPRQQCDNIRPLDAQKH